MADLAHLEIIKQGVDVWNTWREKNLEIWPNLERANLRGVNLQGAELQWTNLQEANLQAANLQAANLKRANLQGAILQDANLQKANLEETNLYMAILQRADLRGSNLGKANLREANLRGANLEGANLKGADLTGTDLHRFIEFPPEYHEASISILNYFATVLRQKYPEKKAKVRIEQDGLKISLEIETETGDRETIERALDKFEVVAAEDGTVMKLFAGDEWSVMDLYRLLHSLNVLYNRLYVLNRYAPTCDVKLLLTAIRNSAYYVGIDDRLSIQYLHINSPAEFSLKGIGEIVAQVRELVKDFRYRNKIEQKMLEADLLSRQIRLLKECGFTDEQIREVIATLFPPLRKITGKAEQLKISIPNDNQTEKLEKRNTLPRPLGD